MEVPVFKILNSRLCYSSKNSMYFEEFPSNIIFAFELSNIKVYSSKPIFPPRQTDLKMSISKNYTRLVKNIWNTM